VASRFRKFYSLISYVTKSEIEVHQIIIMHPYRMSNSVFHPERRMQIDGVEIGMLSAGDEWELSNWRTRKHL
jgi:hypothetical protein